MITIAAQRATYPRDIGAANQRKLKVTEKLVEAGRIGDGQNEGGYQAATELREVLIYYLGSANNSELYKVLDCANKLFVERSLTIPSCEIFKYISVIVID